MLKELNLKPVYDSAEHDLVQDLMVPLLNNSICYTRGVGFFSSGWLHIASKGLTKFVENSGKAKFVISPILSQSDWNAFELGEKARKDDKLKKILELNIEMLEKALKKDTLNTLAWMIADEILEFRFAIAKDPNSHCDYHDKVGVFIDSLGDIVAIHGSFNDSIKGSLNGEAFSVFKSWESGQLPYVEKHKNRLDLLWDKGNSQFNIFKIPDAIKDRFIKLRYSDIRPYQIKSKNTYLKTDTKPAHFANLYGFQSEAIKSWVDSGCRGIFGMATGTGKTFTSLSAAVDRYNELGKLGIIIQVPYLHLIEQWEKNCLKFNFHPILCSSEHGKWHLDVKSKIQDFNINAIDNLCILTTHATASTPKFIKSVRNLNPEYTMIIGDEVHRLGSPSFKNAMIQYCALRLGLSATPKRWFDPLGTEEIFSYFGDVCFEFTLENAIGDYLVPYEYHPILINLTDNEMEEYEDLSFKIFQLISLRESGKRIDENQLKRILLARSRIVAGADNKLTTLLNLLSKQNQDCQNHKSEISHTLVYCAPGKHQAVLKAISNLGIRCHEFVHTVSIRDRQSVLKQFDEGDIQVLVAIKCLDEGVDVPSTRVAYFLASTSNPREFVQRRGRILRKQDGKNNADIYDFILVPDKRNLALKREIDAGILKREMPRFAEFAAAALNEFEARKYLWKILDNYELLNLLDEKPWDVYNKLMQSKEDSILLCEDMEC